jgi:predicted nucleic acid-binding protein
VRSPHVALLLDAEGVRKAARGETTAARFVVAAARASLPVAVSAITLTETLRGTPRDAPVHQLLKGIQVVPVDAEIARAAGALLGTAKRSDTVDAVVVATAQLLERRFGGPVLVLTSDPRDLAALAPPAARMRVQTV